MSPETEARNALIVLLKAAFADDGFKVLDDKLHASLGDQGSVMGISPERSTPSANDSQVSEMMILVQFYGKYDLRVDRTQAVSPSTAESYADRFRNALRGGDPNTAKVWYFSLSTIDFPDDPTGNKTRFEAHVLARGNNTALIETSG